MQTWEEMLITKIITQAVEDARYSGTSEFDLGHKVESISWIVNSDPQFKYYCKLLNIEPSYIQNKIKRFTDTRITPQQKMIIKRMTEKEAIRLEVKAKADEKKLMKKQKISAAVIPRWYNIISKTKNYNEERI
jgi:type II secretory pathway pseudopilin PulG